MHAFAEHTELLIILEIPAGVLEKVREAASCAAGAQLVHFLRHRLWKNDVTILVHLPAGCKLCDVKF